MPEPSASPSREGGTGTQVVELSGCRVSENGNAGIHVDGALVTFDLHDSVVTGNGDEGVHLEGHEDSTYSVTASVISGNADQGLLVQNTRTCTTDLNDTFSGVVMNSFLNANGGDGIEIGGTASCSPPTNYPGQVECGIIGNTIAGNSGYGLDRAGLASAFHRGVGGNIISYNVSGNYNGTSNCSTASVSSNQNN